MANQHAILLFIDDQPVLSSLQFSLTVEGFQAVDGTTDGMETSLAGALIIDQNYSGDGLATLRHLRSQGCQVPAILLATNPTAALRARANAEGSELVEKPLLDAELSRAIRGLFEKRKVA